MKEEDEKVDNALMTTEAGLPEQFEAEVTTKACESEVTFTRPTPTRATDCAAGKTGM